MNQAGGEVKICAKLCEALLPNLLVY